jgi:uncharacterized protein (DUF2384 family)
VATLPDDFRARREVEDILAQLGSERARLESEAGTVLEAIVAAIPRATAAGIPFDSIAKLVGVSRQTLYRWQASINRLRGSTENR